MERADQIEEETRWEIHRCKEMNLKTEDMELRTGSDERGSQRELKG